MSWTLRRALDETLKTMPRTDGRSIRCEHCQDGVVWRQGRMETCCVCRGTGRCFDRTAARAMDDLCDRLDLN